MNWGSWGLWGFVATLTLTGTLSACQGMRFTRINLPFMLGTMATPDRDRAQLAGFGLHFINGWLFSLLYVAAFHSWNAAGWWRGLAIGLVHSGFVLTAGMRLLPLFHPRMADEDHGPAGARMLEPPGFLGLHYGVRTPVSIVAAHAVYGAILGSFYRW